MSLRRPPLPKLPALAWTTLALCACGPTIPPAQPLPPPPPPSAAELATEEEPQTNLYAYSPVGKRDPFRSSVALTGRVAVVDPNLAAGGKLTALQRFDIDQLRLQFTVTGTSSPLAMVTAPNGRGYTVQIGDFVGKNWGKVSHIGREEITVTETLMEQQTGKVYPVYIPMRMPKNTQDERTEELLDETASSGLPQ